MKIQDIVLNLIEKLEQAGHEVFIVGGCVRDLLLGKEPKDWDLTTVARPEEILQVFPDGKYENDFGTVLVPVKNESGETEVVVEITTYRSEQGYSDRRHPDEIIFEDKIDLDLSRRDFTINALAIKPISSLIPIADDLKPFITGSEALGGFFVLDLFGGYKDLGRRMIRAVGEPFDRFREDALRMMRAIRFSSQLGFEIEEKTLRGISKLAGSIKFVSNERIRDELVKILASERPYEGIMLLHDSKILQYILPELERGVGMEQNHHHIYTVFKHSVLSLKNCPSSDWRVRLAALLHDIGKTKTRRLMDGQVTFYNHEYVGAKMVERIADRLKFSTKDKEKVVNLVRNHMFYYNVGEVTAASVRRLIGKVGEENLRDLIGLRIADRLGSGTPKAKPYKLRHLEYMLDKVRHDPVSVKMLKINGNILMESLNIPPSPKIGAILDVLLSEVIENPELNTEEYLQNRSAQLNELDLAQLRERAKEVIEEKKESDDKKIKKRYYVA